MLILKPVKPTICICCGELIAEHGNALSRNPNICASCSSLVDGITDSEIEAFREALAAKEAAQEIAGARPWTIPAETRLAR